MNTFLVKIYKETYWFLALQINTLFVSTCHRLAPAD